MPKVILRFGAALTREQAANAWSEGQKNFWLAKPDMDDNPDQFIFIGKHAATIPLNIELELPYGRYILGCGYGACKLRKHFRVDLMGVRWL